MHLNADEKRELHRHRDDILHQLDHMLDGPMIVLGFVWLGLFVVEVVEGGSYLVELAGTVIWIIFIVDFLIKFLVAPRKRVFLKANWLTAIALIVPALRVFQVFRVLRVLQVTGSVRIVQVMGSINRSMSALRSTMKRRGFGYITLLTVVVTLAGSAGIMALERNVHGGIHSYPYAVYWTVMMITTIGSEYWPQTPAGKVLTVLLSLYAVAVLGYIAAVLASFFIDRDADNKDAPIASEQSIDELRKEIALLRNELRDRVGAVQSTTPSSSQADSLPHPTP